MRLFPEVERILDLNRRLNRPHSPISLAIRMHSIGCGNEHSHTGPMGVARVIAAVDSHIAEEVLFLPQDATRPLRRLL